MYYFLVDLLQPFTVVYIALLVAVVLYWRRGAESRRTRLLVVGPFIVLTLICTPAVSYLAIGTLEWQYPEPMSKLPEDAEAIVVLSGFAFRPDDYRRQTVLALDTQFRCLHGAELYESDPRCPIVVTGGYNHPDDVGLSLAELMRDYLVGQGIDAESILVETKSRSTDENARFTAEILHERNIKRIVLVTTATHMWRSTRSFERAGFEVIPAPCHYRAGEFDWSVLSFVPRAGAAEGFHTAAHEWLGMLYYWLKGSV